MQQRVIELEGLDDQAAVMWQIIERSTGDAQLRNVLAELYRRTDLPARDVPALAAAVQRFVQTHIKYLREHPETYATPLRTLKWRVGDCDDQAMLVCALLRSARVPCRLVFCGTDKGQRGADIAPQHVYAEAETAPGVWTALETVREVPPGWNAVDAWRRKGWRTSVHRHGDSSGMRGVAAG